MAAPVAAQQDSVPYVPTPQAIVEGMLDLAEVGPADNLIDLGSGDGRIVIAAARRGASALGIDRSSPLVARARMLARGEELPGRTRFEQGDLFEARIRDASVVTLYLLPTVNVALRPKLVNELRPGTRIVSHAFDMAEWSPDGHRVVEERNLYLWIVPATVGGTWRLTMPGGRSGTLAFEQRFQRISGTLDGASIGRPTLRGTRVSFVAATPGGQRLYQGIVGDRSIEPDPAAPADAATGWQAVRSD
ncbi:class I SAM-dependent methyltransferase [Sphingomonas qomolangmaensis]|uniref:Methyltransferase domain-containing protein n=1 Tax=Sphingomonas qomolangmaensis TaxID=2918765 RepID=A0ABY5LB56_9SPHN|nr:methyltransferase domain-containing protein [Sphingomonas qomolangmaensis]UUL83361.1 methyltransferase domain-containing protein [Sphingomonas qomolangmaensis]